MIHGKKLQFQIITTIHLYCHDPWEIITTIHLTAITACVRHLRWWRGGERLVDSCVILAQGWPSWGEGVVLLRAERPEARRRAAESDDGPGVVEGHGMRQAGAQRRRSEAAHRTQEDAGVLPGHGASGHHGRPGHERVPTRPRAHPHRRCMHVTTHTSSSSSSKISWFSTRLVVLCKIFRKATSMKELEQRAAAMEEKTLASQVSGSVAVSSPGWPESFRMLSME